MHRRTYERLERVHNERSNGTTRGLSGGFEFVAVEMLANVLAVFAEFERRLIGQGTHGALAVKPVQGERLGRLPTMARSVPHPA
jgi:DNA invertase Pin-like site-specific DNA recombinase